VLKNLEQIGKINDFRIVVSEDNNITIIVSKQPFYVTTKDTGEWSMVKKMDAEYIFILKGMFSPTEELPFFFVRNF